MSNEPRGAYEPLTQERIEQLRVALRLHLTDSPVNWSDVDRLCHMAVNSLLYAEEIQRLRECKHTNRHGKCESGVFEEWCSGCGKKMEPQFIHGVSGVVNFVKAQIEPMIYEKTAPEVREWYCDGCNRDFLLVDQSNRKHDE